MNTLRNESKERIADRAHVQQFERIANGGDQCRQDVEIGAFHVADTFFQRFLAKKKIGKSRRPFALELLVYDGTTQIEIGEENGQFKLCLREREITGGKRFSFGRRSAGADDHAQILLRLHVIEPGSKAAEFFGSAVMGLFRIDEVGFRRGAKRNRFTACEETAGIDLKTARFRAHQTFRGGGRIRHLHRSVGFRNARFVLDD